MKIGFDTKYLRTVLAYFLSAIAAILLIFYFCYHLFNGFEADVRLRTVTASTEQDVVMSEGYLLREETVIRSTQRGVVDYAVADGERVGKGALLARAYTSDDVGVRRRVLAIDEEIALLEASAIAEGVVAADTTATDTLIDELLYTIRDNLIAGRYDYARRETDSLLIQLNKRRLITGQVKNYQGRIASLEAERAGLTAKLAGGAQQLYASRSGYFFYGADGYEEIFRTDINRLTLDSFAAMREAAPVSDSTAVGKLVSDYVWYLAVPTEKTALDPFAEGERYTVAFPYNYDLALTMRLERIVTEIDHSDALLIFSTGEMPEGFSYLRTQHVEITTRVRDGLRVPAEAIRVIDGQTCVYIVEGGVVALRRVEILLERDGECIVARPADLPALEEGQIPWLALHDDVVTAGKALYDGKVLD